MSTRAITIYVTSKGFAVHEGERHSGPLSWDEMLGQIASMTLPRERHSDTDGLFGMRTPEQWAEQDERRRRNWVTPVERELGYMTLDSLRAFAREHGRRGGEFDELLPLEEQDDERVRCAMRLLELTKGHGNA